MQHVDRRHACHALASRQPTKHSTSRAHGLPRAQSPTNVTNEQSKFFQRTLFSTCCPAKVPPRSSFAAGPTSPCCCPALNAPNTKLVACMCSACAMCSACVCVCVFVVACSCAYCAWVFSAHASKRTCCRDSLRALAGAHASAHPGLAVNM